MDLLLTSHRVGWEFVAGVMLLLASFAAFVLLRRLIQRAQLTAAFTVFAVAASTYLSVALIDPGRIQNAGDPFSWWLTRAVVGAMLFVAVRVVDRLIIVPAFSRGGTAQVPRFIHQLLMMVLSIFAVLMYGKSAFGWPIGDFLTGGAVVSIVIGLALQESLGNLFSGLVLQAAPPFILGDYIVVGTVEGRVIDMTWRAVTVHTVDDNYAVIPNNMIARQEIVKHTVTNSPAARTVRVSLEYDLPPCDAIEVLQRSAVETSGVLAVPAPVALLLDYAESGVVYGIKFWIVDPHLHVNIEHDVRVHLWYRLRGRGYTFANPTQKIEHVDLHAKLRWQQDNQADFRRQTLANVPLLKPLSNEQHQQLAEGANSVLLAPGQVLFGQDDPGDSFFIVHQGSADILVKGTNGAPSRVATLGPGDVVGEMSALTGQPRTATVKAATPLSLVEINKTDLQRLIDSDPSILEKISELMAHRNVERDTHMKGIQASPQHSEALETQQQSLLGRMMAFFRSRQEV